MLTWAYECSERFRILDLEDVCFLQMRKKLFISALRRKGGCANIATRLSRISMLPGDTLKTSISQLEEWNAKFALKCWKTWTLWRNIEEQFMGYSSKNNVANKTLRQPLKQSKFFRWWISRRVGLCCHGRWQIYLPQVLCKFWHIQQRKKALQEPTYGCRADAMQILPENFQASK